MILKMSIKEAANLLGVAESTLRRWDNEGKLVADRTKGGHRRYNKNRLIAFQTKSNEVLLC